MKPEVQAAIETRRQWFWVWTLGLLSGLGTASAANTFAGGWQERLLVTTCLILVAAGVWLFIATLRLQKALLAWIAYIAATTTLILYFLFGFINNVLLG